MIALSSDEQAMLAQDASSAVGIAMRVVVEMARLMGADRLVPITHAHIDGCVYFADAGVHFTERLRDLGGQVAVPTSLNVGALDLVNPDLVRSDGHARDMSRRLMSAYTDMGCQPSWTCAPYQAGYRPETGAQIAWAESNAIVFANSVLGARTNRYGDYFDICAALTGRAPYVGLHVTENRRARLLVDLTGLPEALRRQESFYPVLGAWLGRVAADSIPALRGVPADVPEDHLKAMCAAAAATGSVALIHVIGVTPEASTEDDAFAGRAPDAVLRPDLDEMRTARDALSTAATDQIDCVALGSPHFSLGECRRLAALCDGQNFAKPVYVCTRHDVYAALTKSGERELIEAAGGIFVIGTCVVVTPILRQASGVLMTNSGKFAHYSPSTVGHEVVFGSLEECIASAVSGRVARDQALWDC